MEVSRDIRFEILDTNSHSMYLCQTQSLDEAETLLNQAYQRLQQEDQGTMDAAALEQLKATTLNNLGVVECHKGQHRQALNHLESAMSLEERWGQSSPSVALNLCATHNALGHYDKASLYALRAIDLLHNAARTNPAALEEHKVLWGAVWHNLAVAQLNLAAADPHRDNASILSMFRNAMTATIELLGAKHPMTEAVHATYRHVRETLKKQGAFLQHRSVTTDALPPIAAGGGQQQQQQQATSTPRGKSRQETRRQELLVSLRGDDRTKYVERAPGEPYVKPGADQDGKNKTGTPRGLRGIRLSGTLVDAGAVYSNPHPLLMLQSHGSMPSSAAGGSRTSPRQQQEYVYGERTPRRSNKPQPQQQRQASADARLPHPPPSAVGGGGHAALQRASQPPAYAAAPPAAQRVLPDLLSNDLWVDAVPPVAAASPQRPTGSHAAKRPVRPVYAEATNASVPEDDRVTGTMGYVGEGGNE